ncbi:hypothetical protein ACE6H2_008082 [Prunus campanulata]
MARALVVRGILEFSRWSALCLVVNLTMAEQSLKAWLDGVFESCPNPRIEQIMDKEEDFSSESEAEEEEEVGKESKPRTSFESSQG